MTARDAAEAVANANGYTSYDVGMCLQWVRGPCWEVGSFYGSAIDAWNGAKHKHPGDRNPPKGAPCFYRGGTHGHIVIAVGGGPMRSTDCRSSGRVSQEALSWPETAWGDDYLGWTEDLNGVMLPLGNSDSDGSDDMPQYDHAATSKALRLRGGEWTGVTWDTVAGGPAFDEGSTVIELGGRKYSADVHATFDAPEGSTLRIRIVEIESGDVAETGPQTEWLATAGSSFPGHSASGSVKAGRTLRVRVFCSQDATMTAADAVFLSW